MPRFTHKSDKKAMAPRVPLKILYSPKTNSLVWFRRISAYKTHKSDLHVYLGHLEEKTVKIYEQTVYIEVYFLSKFRRKTQKCHTPKCHTCPYISNIKGLVLHMEYTTLKVPDNIKLV